MSAPERYVEPRTPLGRAAATRFRRPGPLRPRRPSRVGDVAASSVRFAGGWGRPGPVRRALATSGGAPRAAVDVDQAGVRPPRWWAPSPEEELPVRGLRRVVEPVPTEGTRRPGAVPASMTARAVPMRLPEEVAAVGRMTMPADSRTRRIGPRAAGSPSRVRAEPADAEPARGTDPVVGTETARATEPAHASPRPGGALPASQLLRRRLRLTERLTERREQEVARRSAWEPSRGSRSSAGPLVRAPGATGRTGARAAVPASAVPAGPPSARWSTRSSVTRGGVSTGPAQPAGAVPAPGARRSPTNAVSPGATAAPDVVAAAGEAWSGASHPAAARGPSASTSGTPADAVRPPVAPGAATGAAGLGRVVGADGTTAGATISGSGGTPGRAGPPDTGAAAPSVDAAGPATVDRTAAGATAPGGTALVSGPSADAVGRRAPAAAGGGPTGSLAAVPAVAYPGPGAVAGRALAAGPVARVARALRTVRRSPARATGWSASDVGAAAAAVARPVRPTVVARRAPVTPAGQGGAGAVSAVGTAAVPIRAAGGAGTAQTSSVGTMSPSGAPPTSAASPSSPPRDTAVAPAGPVAAGASSVRVPPPSVAAVPHVGTAVPNAPSRPGSTANGVAVSRPGASEQVATGAVQGAPTERVGGSQAAGPRAVQPSSTTPEAVGPVDPADNAVSTDVAASRGVSGAAPVTSATGSSAPRLGRVADAPGMTATTWALSGGTAGLPGLGALGRRATAVSSSPLGALPVRRLPVVPGRDAGRSRWARAESAAHRASRAPGGWGHPGTGPRHRGTAPILAGAAAASPAVASAPAAAPGLGHRRTDMIRRRPVMTAAPTALDDDRRDEPTGRVLAAGLASRTAGVSRPALAPATGSPGTSGAAWTPGLLGGGRGVPTASRRTARASTQVTGAPAVRGAAWSPAGASAVLPPRALGGIATPNRRSSPGDHRARGPAPATPAAASPAAAAVAAGAAGAGPWSPGRVAGATAPISGPPREDGSMSYSFTAPGTAEPAGREDRDPAWMSAVEQRVLDRVDAWLDVELDDRVVRILEDKLREETERRAWRLGPGVF